MLATAQGLSGFFVGDEVLKGALASYTFEHMEIASYRILSATAEEAGDIETQRVCEGILREEEAMAEWLKPTCRNSCTNSSRATANLSDCKALAVRALATDLLPAAVYHRRSSSRTRLQSCWRCGASTGTSGNRPSAVDEYDSPNRPATQ